MGRRHRLNVVKNIDAAELAASGGIWIDKHLRNGSPMRSARPSFAWYLSVGILAVSGMAAQRDANAQPADPMAGSGSATSSLDFMTTATPWKTWVVVPIQTRHFNRQAVIRDHLSEDNPGIGVESSNGTWHWMAGAYRNSIRQTSAYAMLGFTPAAFHLPRTSTLSFGGAAGLLTGYQNTQKGYPVVPAGGALLSFETPYHLGFNVFLVPTLKSFQVEGFVATQIKLSF